MHGALVARDHAVFATLRPGIEDVVQALDFFARATSASSRDPLGGERRDAPSAAECAAQADLIRELFGNPFRPVGVNPVWLAWHGGLVVSMARAMYDTRDFRDMRILADALQEAGCADEGLLAHCWSGGGHVRGCWIVDGCLGRG
jgi:hypothetical protein